MSALVVGDFGPDATERIRLAVLRGDAEPRVLMDLDEARDWLGECETPRCIFVDAVMPGVEGFVSWVRGEARLFSVPIVVIVPEVDDDAFLEAHAFGADDVIARDDDRGVAVRMDNLRGFDPDARVPISQGKAIVAHADMGRRRVLGRLLRQGGFDVSFAGHGDELVELAGRGPIEMVVAGGALPPHGAAELVAPFRAAAGRVPFVILSERHERASLSAATAAMGKVELGNENAPPDNLLFLANELLRPDVKNVRASERLLYGTVCAFRRAGYLDPVYGLTYNLSREGMYIRTLAAPARGEAVWFELRPAGHEPVVHLRGRVVWARGLSSGAGGAAPPGFAIQIDEQACPPADLAAYHAAYDAQVQVRRAA